MSNDVNTLTMVSINIERSETPTNNFRVVVDQGQPHFMGTIQQEIIVEHGQRGKPGYCWTKEWRDVPVVERS